MADSGEKTVRDSVECPGSFNYRFGYKPELDGLRGIAILAVLAVHTNHIFGWSLLIGGSLGVDIFFVLSGFLITSILLQEHERRGTISFKRFYSRRVLRLVPALAMMLLTVFLAAPFLYSPEETAATYGAIPIAFLYLSDLAIAFADVPMGVLRHTWSLGIEEQYYLFWPIALVGLLRYSPGKRETVLIVALVIVLSVIYRTAVWQDSYDIARTYYSIDTRADSLLIGCLAGMTLSWNLLSGFGSLRSFLTPAVYTAVLGLALALAVTDYATPILYQGGFTLVAMATAVVIVYVLLFPGGRVGAFLRIPWLVKTGQISYGIYLWHYPVFKAVHYFKAEWYMQLLLAVAGTVAISWMSYVLVERSFLRMKEKFA